MEELSNFRFIWTEWIEPLITDLYKQLDNKFKEYCNVRIRDLDDIYIQAEKHYQKEREEVKRSFYGEYHKGDSKTEHRMDFHKIGAIICHMFIKYKVYDFDENRCKEYVDKNISIYDTDWVVKNAFINFRLAFYSSIVFLFHSMQFEYFKNDKLLYQKICKKDKLDLYDTENTNELKVKESFENSMVLDLVKRNINNHSFDYFMYAIILYQLEEHNKKLLSQET